MYTITTIRARLLMMIICIIIISYDYVVAVEANSINQSISSSPNYIDRSDDNSSSYMNKMRRKLISLGSKNGGFGISQIWRRINKPLKKKKRIIYCSKLAAVICEHELYFVGSKEYSQCHLQKYNTCMHGYT